MYQHLGHETGRGEGGEELTMRGEADNASGADNIPGPTVFPRLDLSQIVFLRVIEVVPIILVPRSRFFRWSLQLSQMGTIILDRRDNNE